MALAEPGHVDWRTRLAIGARTLAAVALALAAAWLATWVAERGPRWRADLTRGDLNTLDASSARVLSELPREVVADVFFSPPEPPFHVAGAEVQARTQRMLRLFADASRGRFTLVQHDLSDPARLAPETQARRHELGLLRIEPGGVVALSSGGRREFLQLRGDLADIDPGNADPRQGPRVPARVVHFRGEEALLGALLQVCEDRTPRVVLTRGHGELDPASAGERGALLLARELEAQGFSVASWDGSRGDPLPAETAVVVLLGPAQRLSEGEFGELAAFLDGGGRLLLALAPEPVGGERGPEALLARAGIAVRERGLVCAPVPSVTGALQTGLPGCAAVAVGLDGIPARNTITDPLRLAGRRVYLFQSRALERGSPRPGTRVVELLRAPPEAWIELPATGAGAVYDWRPGPNAEQGRFALAVQAAFPPLGSPAGAQAGPPPAASAQSGGERAEARVVALGSVDALANHLFASNRDFAVNALDWLAAREYRVRVAPRTAESRRLDLSQPGGLARVHLVAVLLLPGACLVLGLFTAWKRRRT